MTSVPLGGGSDGGFLGRLDSRKRVVFLRLEVMQLEQAILFVREVSELAEFIELVSFSDPGHFMVSGSGEGFPVALQRVAEMLGLRLTEFHAATFVAKMKG